MAIEPTDTPKPVAKRKPAARKTGAKTAAKSTASKSARKPATRKTVSRKPAAAKTTARKADAKSTVESIRDTLNERIVKPAKAAAETAFGAASNAAGSAREAADQTRENIATAASQSGSFGLKMIEHAEHNAREAFNAMRAAAKSKDVSEVMKVQGEYLREQGARSLSQAREVSDLIAQFGRDAIAPLTGKKKKK